MLKNIIVLLFFILLSSPFHCLAQTLKNVEDIKHKAQLQFDKGIHMLNTQSILYDELDSLLNVAYKKLMKKLPPKDATNLRLQQREWLKNRDVYYNKLIKITEKELDLPRKDWRETEHLIYRSYQTEYLEKRVVALINQLQRLNSSNPK